MQDVLKRNNVLVKGRGDKTILFAHGFGCDQNAWRYLSPEFERDHQVVLFDYVGAGKSDISAYDSVRYASLNGYAEDISEICSSLKLKDVIFIGHSVSCIIGALAAIKNPDLFKKLIFIGPSPCYINNGDYVGGFDKEAIDDLLEVMEEDYISWAHSLAPAMMGESNGKKLGKELTDSFCSIDPKIAKQFAKVTFLSDNRTDLAAVPVASLTVQCSGDTIAPPAVGEFIKKHTPDNTLKIIEAQGHCLHMSEPEKTIAAIREFL